MGRLDLASYSVKDKQLKIFLSDHIAVVQYVQEKVSGLTLHLPTRWYQDDPSPRFHDNGNSNIMANPGRSANKLHKQFSDKIGEDTFEHIKTAILLGANYEVHDGFKERNTAVARDSEYLIAFTWNDGKTPKQSGGTHDTWQKHRGKKIHIPIGSLLGEKASRLNFFGRKGSTLQSSEGAGSSSTDEACGTESMSCSTSAEGSLGLEENLKHLQHQPESCDSGCYSGDSQSSSSSLERYEHQKKGIEGEAVAGAKRTRTLDHCGSPKRPRLN